MKKEEEKYGYSDLCKHVGDLMAHFKKDKNFI